MLRNILISWRDVSIATKLAVLFVLLAIAPLIGVGYYNDVILRAEFLSVARAENFQRARGTAQFLDTTFEDLLSEVHFLALLPDTILFLQNPQAAHERDETQIAIIQMNNSQEFAGLYVTDQTGNVLLASDPRWVGRNYVTANWFRNAMAGQTSLDEPRYDPFDAQIYLHLSTPVRDQQGVILGTVIGRITLSQIDQMVKGDNNYSGRGDFGVLWDDLGIRLSHSTTPDLRFKPIMPLAPDIANALIAEARFGPTTRDLLMNPSNLPDVIERSKQLLYDRTSDPFIRIDTIAAGPSQSAFVPLKNKRWLYGVFTPESNILIALSVQRQNAITVAIGTALIAIIFAVGAARWVTRPIRRVAETANALAQGDIHQRVGLAQRDEVGKLGAAFDAMADALVTKETQLLKYTTDLEQMVQARTEEIRLRLIELETVNRISIALRAAQTIEEMLPLLAKETQSVLGAAAVTIWLYDSEKNELRQAATSGFPNIDTGLEPGEGIAGQVFESGQAYISPEFKTDPHTHAALRNLVPPGLHGAAVPIRATSATIGVLFASVELSRPVSAGDIRLLTTVAEIAGNAIHRTRLHAQTEQQLKRLESLHAIDIAIASSFDLPVMLGVFLDHALVQLRVDAGAILVLNPHTSMLEYVAGRGFRSRDVERSHLRLGEGYAGRAALEQRTQSASHLRTDGGSLFERAPLLAGEKFVTYYGVPLTAKGEVIGVLEIFHRSPLNPDAEWLRFMDMLAGQAAIAVNDGTQYNNLQRSNLELTQAYTRTIEGWSRALELRDEETEGHAQRVTEMAVDLARAMGISEKDLGNIRYGALLHDIGKMGIPDAILLKEGPLTEAEWVTMRKHPTYAYDLLAPIAYLQFALDIPHYHHEKWDGTGYPRGLKGEEIPLTARIFAIVDVWDALRSDRPYRRLAWTREKTLEYIQEQAGKHFDPRVVKAFLEIL